MQIIFYFHQIPVYEYASVFNTFDASIILLLRSTKSMLFKSLFKRVQRLYCQTPKITTNLIYLIPNTYFKTEIKSDPMPKIVARGVDFLLHI